MLIKVYHFNNVTAGTIKLYLVKIMIFTFKRMLDFYPMYIEINTTLKSLSYSNLRVKDCIYNSNSYLLSGHLFSNVLIKVPNFKS